MRAFRPLTMHRHPPRNRRRHHHRLRPAFSLIPGQYLTLRAHIEGNDTRRSYSICSGLDDRELRVAIKLVPGGRFSAWAHRTLSPAKSSKSCPPKAASLTAPTRPPATYLGSRRRFRHHPGHLDPEIHPRPRAATAASSSSTAAAPPPLILFREQLEELKDRYLDRLSLVHVLSREQQDIPVLNGRLDAAQGPHPPARSRRPGHARRRFPLRPRPHDRNVSETLAEAGLPPARIHSERFTPSGEPLERCPVRP